jgi:hypothetical protein
VTKWSGHVWKLQLEMGVVSRIPAFNINEGNVCSSETKEHRKLKTGIQN